MRSRRPLLSNYDETHAIWPSFTDVMSTMALILFVLILLAYVHNLVSSKRLEALQAQIGASENRLRGLRSEIQSGRADLARSQAKLRDQEERPRREQTAAALLTLFELSSRASPCCASRCWAS